MDIQALKLDLVQQLVSTNDADVLTRTKRFLDMLLSQKGQPVDDHEEELMAAASLFGNTAYGDDEPDISDLVLKEPNPNYGK